MRTNSLHLRWGSSSEGTAQPSPKPGPCSLGRGSQGARGLPLPWRLRGALRGDRNGGGIGGAPRKSSGPCADVSGACSPWQGVQSLRGSYLGRHPALEEVSVRDAFSACLQFNHELPIEGWREFVVQAGGAEPRCARYKFELGECEITGPTGT